MFQDVSTIKKSGNGSGNITTTITTSGNILFLVVMNFVLIFSGNMTISSGNIICILGISIRFIRIHRKRVRGLLIYVTG